MKKEALQMPWELLLAGGAVEAGIFDALHRQAMDAAELAASLQADRRAVWTVAEALVSLNYLERDGEKYRLCAAAEDTFYRPESESYEGFAFMHAYELIKSWINLPEVIKSGQPARRERGEAGRRYFIQAMARGALASAEEIARFCLSGLPAGAQVLDIGGGPLTYARAFAARGAAVTVLDLPGVVAAARDALSPGENIRLAAGDFTVALPDGPFHLAYLGSICHIYGEEENRALFRRVAAALAPGGRIAVTDLVRGRHPFAAVFAVNMLVNTQTGGTWTREEYASWLTGAGFDGVELREVAGRQLITAVRA
ncbi:methyltransferase [Desulfotomaculum copahuensis]|uniref:Methyltransferase n=1 Tax=Desulfotomaculum copahuensis TaxID=1838280 RepID=A0A1B7LAC4_9FIRM|nr:methyltransferase [Desulfotomaculum copahuensis]OAT79283.1 methyltransferase [Desulfotomaculum copahuensis]